MSAPIFPKSIVPWTDRVDELDVVWARDPNSLAAEIISIESILGVMPHVEKSPYSGNPVTYATVDARISDVLAGTLHPYVTLTATNFYSYNDEQWGGGRRGHVNSYNKIYDSGNCYNGSDITLPVSGLWLITGQQTWEWHDSGYCFHHCYVDDDWRCGHRWDWDFASAGPGYYDNSRQLTTYFSALIPVAAGKRVQSISENGTSRNPYKILTSNLSAYCLRKLPPNALG